MTQQHVPVVQAHQCGDRVLVLLLQTVRRPAGDGLDRIPDIEQRGPGLFQTLVRAVSDPGGGDRAHHDQISEATP